jgi:N-acetylmuramoyl-L-alanine amidase
VIICLDIQHQGKPDHLRDRGAVNGSVEEVDLTRRYAAAADKELRRLGIDCILLSDGRYSDRQKRADSYGCSAYIACHINAGLAGRAGDRSEVYYWPGSEKGQTLAAHVTGELAPLCPWPVRALAAETDRVKGVMAGAKAPALCFEPGFLDGLVGESWLPANAEKLGVALARGIAAWAR